MKIAPRSLSVVDDSPRTKLSIFGHKWESMQEIMFQEKLVQVEADFRYFRYLATTTDYYEKDGCRKLWDLPLTEEQERAIRIQAQQELKQEGEVTQDGDGFHQYWYNPEVIWRERRRRILLDSDDDEAQPFVLSLIHESKKQQYLRDLLSKPLLIRLLFVEVPFLINNESFNAQNLDRQNNTVFTRSTSFVHVKKVMLMRDKEKVAQKYNSAHCSVSVGPYLFDWNEQGFIFPRFVPTSVASFQLHVRGNFSIELIDLPKVTKRLVDWNCTWKYGSPYSASKRTASNWDFVNNFLLWCNLKPAWTKNGFLDLYWEKVKVNAVDGKKLRLWDFEDNREKELELDTHEQLLKFWNSVLSNSSKVDPEFITCVRMIERVQQMRFLCTNTGSEVIDPICKNHF